MHSPVFKNGKKARYINHQKSAQIPVADFAHLSDRQKVAVKSEKMERCKNSAPVLQIFDIFLLSLDGCYFSAFYGWSKVLRFFV